jgi:hypothetical protein
MRLIVRQVECPLLQLPRGAWEPGLATCPVDEASSFFNAEALQFAGAAL